MIYKESGFTEELSTVWLGKSLIRFTEVDSTNLEAQRLAAAGAVHGTVVLADRQTAGKGSRGRSWESPAGTGIFMSILLRPQLSPSKASMLTLVTAYSMARVLNDIYELDVKIKWPNDIVLNRRKAVGILTEMQTCAEGIRYVVVGSGANVNTQSFPEELADKATSLYLETGHCYNIEQLTVDFLHRLEQDYDRFLETEDLAFIKQEYEALLINKGEPVRVLDAGTEEGWTGTALGINKYGELLIRHRDGSVEEVSSGEVSVRGLYSYV